MYSRRPQRSTAFSTTDTSTAALNISLGVEFEFLLLQSFQESDKPDQPRTGTAHTSHGLSLASSIFKKAMPVACLSCEGTHGISLDSHQQTPNDTQSNHAVWNIVSDDTVKLDSKDQLRLWESKCDSYAVEVTSRTFSAGQTFQGAQRETRHSHVHKYTYQQEMASVLSALQSNLNSLQGGNLILNETCAFHVHIGNGSSGFPLQTVKNVLCIHAAFERLIDGMHTASRIGGSQLARCALNSEFISPGDDVVGDYPVTQDIYNVPLTEHLVNSAYVIRRNSRKPQEDKHEMNRYPAWRVGSDGAFAQAACAFDTMAFIEVVQQAPAIDALKELFARKGTRYEHNEVTAKKTDVNILNLSEPADPSKTNTIEFRQHAGVTTPEETLPWIDFVQTLVRYAHDKSAEEIRELCANAAENPHFTLKDLFGLLNVSSETQKYYLNRIMRTTDDAPSAEADQSNTDDPIQSLVQKLAAQRKAESNPQAVTSAVRNKFRLGGYGQFSREFIDEYVKNWSEEEKDDLDIDRLVMGYQEPDEPELEALEDGKLDEERDSEMGDLE